MIELNKKTQQDFLNREWVQRLLDAGVDMSDAKYKLVMNPNTKKWYVTTSTSDPDWEYIRGWRGDGYYHTYTVSELLYKLHEWIYPTIDGVEYSGGLKFCKDAPFYIFYYALKAKDFGSKFIQDDYKEDYISAEFEYPIESLASLLIQCHQKDIGIATKDTGNISDK